MADQLNRFIALQRLWGLLAHPDYDQLNLENLKPLRDEAKAELEAIRGDQQETTDV